MKLGPMFLVLGAVSGALVEHVLHLRQLEQEAVGAALIDLQVEAGDVDLIAAVMPFALLRNFDPLVESMVGLAAARRRVPSSVPPTVQPSLEAFDQHLERYEKTLEEAKSRRAALTNVEHYLPTRLRELQEQHPDDATISQVRSDVLAYLLHPSAEHLHALERQIAALETQSATQSASAPAPAPALLTREADHLRDLVTLRKSLQSAASALTRDDVGRQASAVMKAWQVACTEAVEQARRVRLGVWLALCVVGLLLLWRRGPTVA